MVDILHRVGIKTSSPDKVYDALTTVEGLAGWWTDDTRGSGVDRGGLGGRAAEPVAWRVVDGPDEWIGTTIDWDLRQDGDWTIVLFRHQDWKEPVEFMHHCSTK